MAILGGGADRQKLSDRANEIADLRAGSETTSAQISNSGTPGTFPSSVDLFMPWHPKPKESKVNPYGKLHKPNV